MSDVDRAAEAVGQWFGERCEPQAGAKVGSTVLYADFTAWAKAGKRFPLSHWVFSRRLAALGIARARDARTRRAEFRGVTLRKAAVGHAGPGRG